jgi:hypothetical protein
MTRGRLFCCLPLIAMFLTMAAVDVAAAERYAVIVSGASGGEAYAKKYNELRTAFTTTLRETFGYKPERLYVLAEDAGDGVEKATRENVQRVFALLRDRVAKDDQVLIFLMGHGTMADGDEAKFNLVGPDLNASEWAQLVGRLQGRVVFVNTTGASFPFLHKLAKRGRVVLTATDSAAQQFETLFPEHFIRAFDDDAADFDKNGRVSIWEAFTYASAAVRQAFEQKGELPTERSLLDDTGGGVGREAQTPGTDGSVARVTYLEPEPALELPSDAALATLIKRRAALENALDELKARKESMPPDQYDAELERVLTELARVSLQIKAKS